MAIYKFFVEKDNFLSSQYPSFNYGRDEILDISNDSLSSNRAILYFNQGELLNTINVLNITSSSSILKLYLANASNIPLDYNIEIYPLSQSWSMGTGRSGDEPNPFNGSCWNDNGIDTSSLWNGGNYITSSLVTQSFSYDDNKDINVDISSIVNSWVSGDINNNGIIIKHTDEIESSSIYISSRYFSIDTHTVYPPHIELVWDDIQYSSSLPQISSSFISTIINNKAKFKESSIYTFRIKSRDEYPTRMFQTGSIYLNNKVLPEESYWSLKDVKTNETVIDFHNIGTKVGADNNGNYFNMYMNGLQPERYYQILIKTIINNNTIIIDNKSNYFKIVR